MREIMLKFSASILPLLLMAVLAVVFLFQGEFLRLVWLVGASWLASFILKVIFKETRPSNHKAFSFISLDSVFSFPSSHSAIFAAIAVSWLLTDTVLGITLSLFAVLIGSCRALIDIHYWRDIIFGWLLGFFVAFATHYYGLF